jgi:hypothetical protein
LVGESEGKLPTSAQQQQKKNQHHTQSTQTYPSIVACTTKHHTMIIPSTLTSFTLRDPKYGWLHFVALGYALVANAVGLICLLQWHQQQQLHSWTVTVFFLGTAGILASAHGKVIASYLVHEAAHGNIFRNPLVEGNQAFGVVALYLAGAPYADFSHVKQMHISHHKDRAE